jgi:protein-S-isoprenylcysteine O-methyltransferase Ste14
MTKRLDPLWVLASIAFAIWSLAQAWQHRHLEGLMYFGLHLQAAVLFSLRNPGSARATSGVAYAVAVVSVMSPYAYDVVATPIARGLDATLVVTGCVLAFLATWSLGRSYGVLPMSRGLRRQGAYAFVRHPLYASYIIMDAGIVVGAFSARNLLVFIAAVGLYFVRALWEEELLLRCTDYADYAASVPNRFFPTRTARKQMDYSLHPS